MNDITKNCVSNSNIYSNILTPCSTQRNIDLLQQFQSKKNCDKSLDKIFQSPNRAHLTSSKNSVENYPSFFSGDENITSKEDLEKPPKGFFCDENVLRKKTKK